MKKLKDYIIEGQNFLVNKKLKNRQDKYGYHPSTKDELQDIIVDLLKKGETDLNCIDVSAITDMGFLFSNINANIIVKDIDISEWDVSNVINMNGMFYSCNKFTSDLSEWDVFNVTDMRSMFWGCKEFNSDLSKWNVSNVTNMQNMFENCNEFNADLSNWNTTNVTNMHYMFYECKKFNSDLSKWNISNVKHMLYMFDRCDTLKKNNLIPDWYSN